MTLVEAWGAKASAWSSFAGRSRAPGSFSAGLARSPVSSLGRGSVPCRACRTPADCRTVPALAAPAGGMPPVAPPSPAVPKKI